MSPTGTRAVLAVVVNYRGRDHTPRAVESLAGGGYPELRVVVVDNDGDDGVGAALADRPGVEVVVPGSNLGFAAAADLGIGHRRPGEWVVLLNNDARVEPGWLEPLVAAMEADPGLGAVNPKVLLEGSFAPVDFEVPATGAGPLDARRLGLAVGAVVVDGEDRTDATRLPGFWEPTVVDGVPARWGPPRGGLWVPAPTDRSASATLQLAAPRAVTATLRCGGETTTVALEPRFRAVRLRLGDERRSVLNSTGAEIDPDWRGGDVAIDTADESGGEDEGWAAAGTGPATSAPAVVDRRVWTGAAALLRDRYLDDVGCFDERYFVYYEDIELALRGRRRGWRYGYVPAGVVHHALSSAAGAGSSFQRRYAERNRLLTVARHAPVAEVPRVLVRYLLVTASYLRRDVLARLLARRRPDPAAVSDRLAALGSFLRLLPGTLRRRGADRRR